MKTGQAKIEGKVVTAAQEKAGEKFNVTQASDKTIVYKTCVGRSAEHKNIMNMDLKSL